MAGGKEQGCGARGCVLQSSDKRTATRRNRSRRAQRLGEPRRNMPIATSHPQPRVTRAHEDFCLYEHIHITRCLSPSAFGRSGADGLRAWGQRRRGTRAHAGKEPLEGHGRAASRPARGAWTWSRGHASFSHTGAESQDAAATLLHTRREKSKRSRAGCRSAFSSPAPGVCGPVWRSPVQRGRAAGLGSTSSSRGGVLGLFQGRNSSCSSKLPPQKLETRNSYKGFCCEQKKRLHSQSARIFQKCLHGAETGHSLFKLLFQELLGCLPCCPLSQLCLLSNSRPSFLLCNALQKSLGHELNAVIA